jgi:hypothetical protein
MYSNVTYYISIMNNYILARSAKKKMTVRRNLGGVDTPVLLGSESLDTECFAVRPKIVLFE